MMEMKIKVEAPALAAAIEKLAAAIAPIDPAILTPDESRPVANPTPPPATTAAAPTTPAPVTTASPVDQTVTPGNTAPVMPQTPGPAAPAPAMPTATAPAYTLDQISKAGAALVDAGKMEPLLGLLAKYGVQAVTQLQPAQYGAFATELRALGAQI